MYSALVYTLTFVALKMVSCCKLAKRVALASLQTEEVKASTMAMECHSACKLVQLVHIVLSLIKFLSEKGDDKQTFSATPMYWVCLQYFCELLGGNSICMLGSVVVSVQEI